MCVVLVYQLKFLRHELHHSFKPVFYFDVCAVTLSVSFVLRIKPTFFGIVGSIPKIVGSIPTITRCICQLVQCDYS